MSHIVPMSESAGGAPHPEAEPEQPIPQQEGQEHPSVEVVQEHPESQEPQHCENDDESTENAVPEASPTPSRHSSGHQCRVNVSWMRTQGRSFRSYFKKYQVAGPSSPAPSPAPSPVPDASLSPDESLLAEASLSPDASLDPSLSPGVSQDPSLDSHPSLDAAPSPSLWEWAPDAFKKSSPSASEGHVATPTPTLTPTPISWRATAEPPHCSSALPGFTAPKSSFKDAPACRLYVPPAVREFVAEQLREQQQQREQGPPKPLSWRAVARPTPVPVPAPRTEGESARRGEPKKDEDRAAKKFGKGHTNSVSTATELKTAKIRGREFYNSMLTKTTKPDSSSSSRKLSWSSYLSRRRQTTTHAAAMTQQGITPPPKKSRKQTPADWRVHPEDPRNDVEVPLFQNPDFHLKTDKSTDEEIALIYRHLDSLGEAMINHIEQGLYDDLRRQASATDKDSEQQQQQQQQYQLQQQQMHQMQMQQLQMQQHIPQTYQPQIYQPFQELPSHQDQMQKDLQQLHMLEQQMQHLRMQEQELQHRLMQDQQYRDYRIQDQQMKQLEIPADHEIEMPHQLMQQLQTQTQPLQPVISEPLQPQFLPQPQIHDQMLNQLQIPDPQTQQPADPQQQVHPLQMQMPEQLMQQLQVQHGLFQSQPQPIQEQAIQTLPVQQQQLQELHMQQQQLQMHEQHVQQHKMQQEREMHEKMQQQQMHRYMQQLQLQEQLRQQLQIHEQGLQQQSMQQPAMEQQSLQQQPMLPLEMPQKNVQQDEVREMQQRQMQQFQQMRMQEQQMQQQQSLLDPSVPSPLTYAPQATLAALCSPNDPVTATQAAQATQNPRIRSLQAMLNPSPQPEWGRRFRPELKGAGHSKLSRFFPKQDLGQHGDGPGQDRFLGMAAKGGLGGQLQKGFVGKPTASTMAGDGNGNVFVRAVGDPYYRSPGASKASPVKPDSFPYLKALKQDKENQQDLPGSWRCQAPPQAAPAADNVAKVPFRTTVRKLDLREEAAQPRFNQYAGNKPGTTSNATNGRNKVQAGQAHPRTYNKGGTFNGPKKGPKDPKDPKDPNVASGQAAGAANQGGRMKNKAGKSSRRVDSQGFVLIGGEGKRMPHLEPAGREDDMGNQFNLLDDNDC